MNFGEKLKLLRYERGLTQDDLGYILNVSKSCVSYYESGAIQPSIDILISISSFFKVSIDFLIGMEPYDFNRKEVTLTNKDIELIEEFKNKPNLYTEIIKDIPKFISKIEKVV